MPRTRLTSLAPSLWCLLILPFLFVAVLRAQTITGTWQATEPTGDAPRIALKIVRNDDGSLRGTFYRVEPNVTDIPFTSVTFTAPKVSVVIAILNASYQAKLNSDGKSLDGTWTAGKDSYPLTFTLATPGTLWKKNGDTMPVAMAAGADPSFEVATIRPSAPGVSGRRFNLRTRHFTARNATFLDLMRLAYRVRDRQIEGAPAWFSQQRFDIDGEPDKEGLPSDDQDREMLRKLLADRFQFKIHTVDRVVPVYALSVEAEHPKLIPSGPDDGKNNEHIFTEGQTDERTLVRFVAFTMPAFGDLLMNFIQDRQIVDETGLSGRFDFNFSLPTASISPAGGDNAPEFFRAVQSLGLKLTAKKAPIQFFIVDHVEQPSAN